MTYRVICYLCKKEFEAETEEEAHEILEEHWEKECPETS